MMQPKLSICIPTYNRALFLRGLLDSILSQAPADGSVEICISDNASNDNTAQVVKSIQEEFSFINYMRNRENIGPDRNFLRAVEIASGEYCWLMGSDDIVLAEAIDYILRFIRSHGTMTGFSLNQKAYSSDLSVEIPTRSVSGGHLDADCLLTDLSTVYSHLGSHMGYLSGNIVNRRAWNIVVNTCDLTSYFNGYIHVYVIGRMVKNQARWGYIHRPCIGWRRGNDSFATEGLLKRARIDVYGYEAIARGLFGAQSIIYRRFLRTIISGQLLAYLLAIKLHEPDSTFPLLVDYIKVYRKFPIFWAKIFPLFLVPGFVFRIARPVYQAYFK